VVGLCSTPARAKSTRRYWATSVTVAGHALLDGDRRRQARERVDVGFRQLFDELAGVGRDAFEEAALAFGEEDVEREGRFAGAGDAGHHRERAVRDLERDVLQVVLAGAP